MAIVSTRLDPNLEVFGEVQEFNFPATQNRGRVDIRTELAPTPSLPTQSGLTLKDSGFNGYRLEYESCFDATQNTLGLYEITNNERAATPILLFSGTPTLDNHIATKKYVDDHSGGGGGGADKTYVDQQDAATLTSAKAYTDTGNAATLASAETFAATGNATTLSSAKSYADTGDAATLDAAKADATTKANAAVQVANGYTNDAIASKADTIYVDDKDTATLNAAKTYTDGKSGPFSLDNNSVAIANALGLRIKNNASSATYTVFLNGNGDGWTETYSETWSNIWSKTTSFKTTTYITFQNASGVNIINANQPIVMSSTYTPTAAKHVATKDYVDGKSVSLPIDSSGTLAVDFSGKTSPSYTNTITAGKTLQFGAQYPITGAGNFFDFLAFNTASRQIGFGFNDYSGTYYAILAGPTTTSVYANTFNIIGYQTSGTINIYGSASSSSGWNIMWNYSSATNNSLSVGVGSTAFLTLQKAGGTSSIQAQQTITMATGYSPVGVNDVATKGTLDGAVPIGGEVTCPKNYTPSYGTWRQCNGTTYPTDGSYYDLQTRLVAAGRAAGVLPTRTAPDSFTWVLIRVL